MSQLFLIIRLTNRRTPSFITSLVVVCFCLHFSLVFFRGSKIVSGSAVRFSVILITRFR